VPSAPLLASESSQRQPAPKPASVPEVPSASSLDSQAPARQRAPELASVPEPSLVSLPGLQPSQAASEAAAEAPAAYADGTVALLDAQLLQSPDASIDVDGPRGVLRTTWLPMQPPRAGTRLDFTIQLRDGEQVHVWDVADQWWNPPDHWLPNQPVTMDVPDVPMRQFASWQASFVRP
jgi:hypothetical protein